MNTAITDYLKKIDEVIAKGPYKNDWASLHEYPIPKWYRDAKFGIFIHWGVYSVPAFGNEWYPRRMYLKGTPDYDHHLKTYGDHKTFGYKDFIPMFKAEKFDAADWMKVFKEAGARYVMPVAEHHDGFQMYDSAISNWNAAKMGPKRDVLGELKAQAEKEGIVFTASSHRAENFWFFAGGREFDSGIKDIGYEEPYGYAHPDFARNEKDFTHNIEATGATKEHLEDWLARTCELVDKYRPKILWFDWWIHNMTFKPYLKKFAAYYYNRAKEWGIEVAINYKYEAFANGTAVFDIERGQLSGIRPRLWQNDTAVAKNSWGYTENNQFKNPVDLVCDLVDIASKNGCLLLNVGPKSDGTITAEDRKVLAGIGSWLKVNGEAIYDTTYWATFGEGTTEVPEGAFTDTKRTGFNATDIRFTWKAPYLYATVLKWPEDGRVKVLSLKNKSKHFLGKIQGVEVLGFPNKVRFTRTDEALEIAVDGSVKTEYPVSFKIQID